VKADRVRLLVVAAAGIVIAHAADYALAFPDPVRRSSELATTGHGYWPVAVVVATVCGVVGLALAARKGWRGEVSTAPLTLTATQLAAGQVALFALVESVERLAVGGHPLAFLASMPFAIGVVLQVAVAVAAAVVLRGVEEGAHRVAAALRRSRGAGTDARIWRLPTYDQSSVWWGVAGDARGPPLTLPA
jgi:hypothetical protein